LAELRDIDGTRKMECVRSVHRVVSIAVATAVGACAAGCSQISPHTQTQTVTHHARTVTLAQDGARVVVQLGQPLTVVLSSTYWVIPQSTNPRVLKAVGPERLLPHPEGCVPGEGCGIASRRFVARSRGIGTIRATRSSCGEAAACTGTSGMFRVTVTVR
jgi:hypothetical protein